MMRFVQSYARTHAHAYSHTPMRRCQRTMTRSVGTDGNPTNRDPGLRKRAPSTALGLLGVSPPASQEGTSAILWRCILLALRSERASSADEALFLIFDGNRTGPGGRLATDHSVRAQRSRAEDVHRSPVISQRSYVQPPIVIASPTIASASAISGRPHG